MSGAAAAGVAAIAICVAVIVLIVVLIVVAIVVAVVLLLRPRIDLDQFTAEIRSDYGRGRVINSVKVVRSSTEWWLEQYYDNRVFVRAFSDDYSDYITLCNHIGEHDSCVSLTSTASGSYTVPKAMSLSDEDIPCPQIHDPVIFAGKKRTLSRCDRYKYLDNSFERYDYVERETGYPVLRNQLQYTYGNKEIEFNLTEEFTYFDDEKPKNKTGLEPPSGVTVYDFRDGYTNAASAAISRVAGWFKSIFSSAEAYENPTVKATFERFEREKAFREKTGNWLFSGFSNVGVGSTPDHMKARSDASIPDSFDARENWPQCKKVINTITNQQSCGSCWAMSTAGVLSDRACIKYGSKISYSPRYMMGCYTHQTGCNGGFIGTVWDDVKTYRSVPEECFSFKPYDAECPTKCENGTLIKDSMKSPRVADFYSPWAKDSKERVQAIQQEIMTNGPVTVSMLVFSGFRTITTRVYTRSKKETYEGGHMVRIIGWGKDSKTDYWLVANSWGDNWGDNGYFKIRRGTNECNIENTAIAGYF